jgi:hypothetical protein
MDPTLPCPLFKKTELCAYEGLRLRRFILGLGALQPETSLLSKARRDRKSSTANNPYDGIESG